MCSFSRRRRMDVRICSTIGMCLELNGTCRTTFFDVLHVSISRHDIPLLFVGYLHTKRRNDFELKVTPTMVCLRVRSQSKIGTSYRNLSSLGRYRWVIVCRRMRQCIVSPAVCLLELYGRHDSNQR